MWIEALNILVATLATIIYFFLCYRVFIPYLHKFNYPFNNATKFLLGLSFLGAAIVLYFFGGPAMHAFGSLAEQSLSNAIFVFTGLLIVAMIYSIVLFRFVVQITLKENEKAELAKNNFQVAGFHGVVHVFFALLLSEKVVLAVLQLYVGK
jgi:hypothetical protein